VATLWALLSIALFFLVVIALLPLSPCLLRYCVGRLGRGHTKETGNRNATAISEDCYQLELNTCCWMEQRKLRKELLSAWVEHMLLNGAAQIEETATQFPPFSNMCSTQADHISRKLRLRCGCQFPWCALGLSCGRLTFPFFLTNNWIMICCFLLRPYSVLQTIMIRSSFGCQ
jgi:hypothetical protein